jgi:hypothetical protein
VHQGVEDLAAWDRRRESGAGESSDHQDMQDGVLVVDLNGVVRGLTRR